MSAVVDFLAQLRSHKLYVVLGSVALVFLVIVMTSMAVVSHFCPRSRHIVYLRDTDCSKTKQSPSKRETVPLVVDKFVSKHYRVAQQRYVYGFDVDEKLDDIINNLKIINCSLTEEIVIDSSFFAISR